MTTTPTAPRPVHLGLPLPEPQGAPGCGVCDALVAQRRTARLRGDLSGVTDCNVELRNHGRAPRAHGGGDDDGGHGADNTDIEDGDGNGGSGSPGHCH